jgi:hypothetical protein
MSEHLIAREGDAESAVPEVLSSTYGRAPFCHFALGAAIARTKPMMHLAASRTEVPKTEIQAVTSSSDFADTDPPLWEGLGSVTYKISTTSANAQSYFDQGPAVRGRRIRAIRPARGSGRPF